jgi:hypothetical protein
MRTTTQAHKEYHNNLCTKTANTKRDEKKKTPQNEKICRKKFKKKGTNVPHFETHKKKNG